MSEKQFKPTNKEELKKLVENKSINLGSIDTSLITDMRYLFLMSKREDFSGIETWDVSNVTDMAAMFKECETFNQPLNSWDVSNVTNMYAMFYGAKTFNQPLDKWNISKVTSMGEMFMNAKSFNQV